MESEVLTERERLEEMERELRKKEAKFRKELFNMAAVVLAISAIGVGVLFSQAISSLSKPSPSYSARGPDLSVFSRDLGSAKADLIELKGWKETVQATGPGLAMTKTQADMLNRVPGIERRIESLEEAIQSTPEKALSIPLLRIQLEESDKRLEMYRQASAAETERLYEQQKWMLGGIGTVLLAVAGGAVTILLKGRAKSEV